VNNTEFQLLQKLVETAKMCVRCNYCNPCPTFTVDGWESVSPRGKLQLIRDIAAGNITIDARIVKDVYKCSVCGLCQILCPIELPLLDLWESLRAELVNQRVAPLSMHRKLKEITFRNLNPYGEEQERRGDWLEFGIDEKSKVLYFAGCTASFRLKGIAKSTASVLRKLGIEFTYAGKDEVCCGSPFLRTGQRDVVERLFMKNYRVWEKMGIETIITSCPGCYRTIAKDYPRVAEEKGVEFNIEVVHTVSILDEYLSKKVDANSNRIRATYHDPCHLGRHMEVYDPPRNIIRKLCLELVEMEKTREFSLCCGAGGGLRSQFRDISFEIGRERVMEAIKTGAELLITCCPFCEYHLSKSAEKLGNRIRVVDLVELADKMI
jgi:Fe-S oxidoreductase